MTEPVLMSDKTQPDGTPRIDRFTTQEERMEIAARTIAEGTAGDMEYRLVKQVEAMAEVVRRNVRHAGHCASLSPCPRCGVNHSSCPICTGLKPDCNCYLAEFESILAGEKKYD